MINIKELKKLKLMDKETIQARRRIGLKLKQHIEDNKLIKTHIARDAGVTRERVNFIINGNRDYTVTTLIKVSIAAKFDIFNL